MTETPIKLNQELLDMECISVGKKGDGVFKYDGFIIIVPQTTKGYNYNIKITGFTRNLRCAFGTLI